MLNEGSAWTLLDWHCEPLRDFRWIGPSSDWYNCGCAGVTIVVRPCTANPPATTGREIGARLRLALAVVQAVSCCRGFEPAVNQSFWRRVMLTMWGHHSKEGLGHRCALSPWMFDHVGITWDRCVPDDDAFWLGFFHGTAECDALLTAVLTRLRPHLGIDALPRLQVSLSSCSASYSQPGGSDDARLEQHVELNRVVPSDALNIMLRAALATPAGVLRNPRPATMQFGLVVECRVGDPYGSIETLDLLAQVRATTRPHLHFTIDRLVIELVPSVAPRSASSSIQNRRALVTRSRALGPLLRTLLVQDNARSALVVRTVAVLGCSYSDYRLVGAVLSAVALASPPVAELRCSGVFDKWRPQDQLLRLAWLAYALHRQRRRHHTSCLPLALSLKATDTLGTEQESAYMQQLVARGTPLRDVVGEALRLACGGNDDKVARLRVACLRDGSTVRFTSGTRLYAVPLRVADEFVAVVLAQDEHVDLITHIVHKRRSCVGVVYAGYGLLWAEASSVVAWHRVEEPDDDVVMTEDDHGHGSNDTAAEEAAGEVTAQTVVSLALGFEFSDSKVVQGEFPYFPGVTAILPVVACEKLEALYLDRAVLLRDDLARLLDSFPQLHTLALGGCMVESLVPLADAYTRPCRRACPTTLHLHGTCNLSSCQQVVTDNLVIRDRHADDRDDGRAFAWLAPLLAALAHGVVRTLSVDLVGMRAADVHVTLRLLAQTMAMSHTTQSLTNLSVLCHGSLSSACAAHLGPLQDSKLGDPPRVRCAVVSVLLAFGCTSPEIARTVLALSDASVVRTILWS